MAASGGASEEVLGKNHGRQQIHAQVPLSEEHAALLRPGEEPACGTTPRTGRVLSHAEPQYKALCASRSTIAYACQTVRKGSPRSRMDTLHEAHLLLDTIFF